MMMKTCAAVVVGTAVTIHLQGTFQFIFRNSSNWIYIAKSPNLMQNFVLHCASSKLNFFVEYKIKGCKTTHTEGDPSGAVVTNPNNDQVTVTSDVFQVHMIFIFWRKSMVFQLTIDFESPNFVFKFLQFQKISLTFRKMNAKRSSLVSSLWPAKNLAVLWPMFPPSANKLRWQQIDMIFHNLIQKLSNHYAQWCSELSSLMNVLWMI